MKQKEQNIHVGDFYKNIKFSDELEHKWQEIVDLLANLLKVPAALIMRVKPPDMEVFKTSNTANNPYKVGDKDEMFGLYCETVIKTQQELLVPNALKDTDWDTNPDIKLGMISYLGFPINFPDQTPFGTICILDTKENSYNEYFKKLLLQFKSIIELDLKIYIDSFQQQKKLELSIEKKNQEIRKLSEAVNQSTHSVIITDPNGKIEYVNPKFTEVSGYTEHEVKGQTPSIFKSGFTDKAKYKQLWEALDNGSTWAGELLNKKKNGELFWERISIYPIRNKKNKPVNYVAIKEDITEYKKDQEALIQAGEIWDNIPIGIYIFELENSDDTNSLRIVSFNPSTYNILGIAGEDILNQKINNAFPGLIGTDLPERFANVVRSKRSISIDCFHYSDPEKNSDYFSIKAFPLQEKKLVVSFENITEKKEFEILLKQKFDFIEFTNKISSSLINIPTKQIDREINKVLKHVTQFANAIRGYVYHLSEDEKTMVLSNEWSKPNMDYRKSGLASIQDPNYHMLHRHLEVINYKITCQTEIESTFELSTQKSFRKLNIGSFISLGLFRDQKVIGIIGFDFKETSIEAPQYLLDIFSITTNVISNAKERVFADKQLRESEEMFKSIFHNAGTGIALLGLDGKILKANKTLEKLYSDHVEELNGKNFIKIVHPDFIEESKTQFQKIVSGELNEYKIERKFINSNGAIVFADLNVSSVLDNHGNTKFVVALVEDITDKKNTEEKLRKSEAKHKLISAISSDYVYSIQSDETGKYLIKWVSGAFERISGYTVQEINDMENRWDSIIHPEDLNRLKQEYSKLRTLKISTSKEYRIITKNGSIKWLSDSYVQLSDSEEEKNNLIHGSIKDISDRKMAELALIESEERLMRLSEVAEEGIFIHDNFRIVEANEALTKISGYKRSELLGMDSRKLASKATIQTIMDHQKASDNAPYVIEGVRKDDSKYAMETQGKPYIFKGKDMRVVIVRDVSEKIKAEQALIESEEKFSKIFDLNPGIVVIIDEENRTLVEINQGIIEILGYTRDELVGKTTIELGFWTNTGVNEREKFYEEYNKNIGFAHMVSDLRKKNGELIICDISAKRIEINGRNHLFVVGVDLTETRRAEAKIKTHNKEMITLNKQMAEYKMMALRSAMNPHFVFNCLNSIQYFIAGNDKRSAINYLSLFSKLIRNVLNSSVHQYTTLEKEVETLKYYIELEKLRFDDKFDFILSLDEDLDAGEIEIPSLIIQPYIENAIIHGLTGKNEQGTLLLEIKSQNDKLLCVVEDDGIGRKKSQSFNLNKKLAHKSVGMSVTEERLNIVNKTNDVSVNIIDLEEDGKATGTRVELLINMDKR